MALDSKDKKRLAKQRRENAKQAQKFHKKQNKKAKKSSDNKTETFKKPSASKIKEAVDSGRTVKFQKISREEKFRREGEEKIRNLKPHDFEDGYYIDEYSVKKRIDRRAEVIRKQESEVIRRRKKPLTQKQARIRRILLASATLLVVIAVGVILSLTVLFKTEKIEVEGCSHYYDEQIIGFSNVSLQQNIFIGKLNSTPQDIIDNLAYVEDAQISFSIPDTIIIKITDAVPNYFIREGNNYLLLSSKGRILEKVTELPDNLTELICGDVKGSETGGYVEFADPSIPDILQSVAKSIKDNGLKHIVGFDVTDLSAITLDYAGRIKIKIGLAEDIDYKIRTAMTIIDQKLDPNNTGQIYGTLDVSMCSKNKMSHYVPADTIPTTVSEATTVPETTAAAPDYNGYDDSYNWYGDDTYDDNSWDSSDNWSNDSWNDNSWDNGSDNNYDYDNNWDDGNSYDYDNGGNDYYDDSNDYNNDYVEPPQY